MKRQIFLKSVTGLGLFTLIPQNAFAKVWSKIMSELKPKIIRNEKGNLLNVIGDIQTHKLSGSETDCRMG